MALPGCLETGQFLGGWLYSEGVPAIRPAMSALRLLALSYLVSASIFVVAATLVAHPELTREFSAGVGAMAERQ